MSRIFLAHSSANNAEAVALHDWLAVEGWDDVFLDLDPNRGIAAGERWERALNEAANRCEAVLFLVSRAWLASRWCLKELNLAHRLNKRLFGLLIEDIPVDELPGDLTATWQLVRLATGRDHVILHAELPVTHETVSVTMSAEGLARLRTGLARAGLDPRFFPWPPADDPKRAPYRGLKPMEGEDAGIFFGREAAIITALDTLRGLREGAPPRLLVILGASGAGKSSVLRAGLLPRLTRDDRHFLALPVIRPERAVLSGETGLVRSLEAALKAHGMPRTRADLKAIVSGGTATLQPLLAELVTAATPPRLADEDTATRPPTVVLSIDQGEELFLAEGAEEAQAFLTLLRALVDTQTPDVIALFTIRTDSYEPLQSAQGPAGALASIKQMTLSLPPMPQGAYAQVIEGPVARLASTPRALKIDPKLTEQLLADIEAGGAKDALPLLAFTLERLYLEHGGDGDLTLAEYQHLGGVRGSIEAAVEGALRAADTNRMIPDDRRARLALLRRGLIPWLAGIDPSTANARRRIARLSEIPVEARPLIDLLVEARLLATDMDPDTGEATIEPAHDALLRQWGLLEGWLEEDFGALATLEALKRAARDWKANASLTGWLVHSGSRLATAESVCKRDDLSRSLEPADWAYLRACQTSERAASRTRRRLRTVSVIMATTLAIGLVGWINQGYIVHQWLLTTAVRPYYLSKEAELSLPSGQSFFDCGIDCPEMVVVPAGEHRGITLNHRLAVSKYEIAFSSWDRCVNLGGCSNRASDEGWGRGRRPTINVSWDDAMQYVKWISKLTGKEYRLLSSQEWLYAARIASISRPKTEDALVNQTIPVDRFGSNELGLVGFDGNVTEWVSDCFALQSPGTSDDRLHADDGMCDRRTLMGASHQMRGIFDQRFGYWKTRRSNAIGFRVSRSLGD